jgi:endonuclease/exonuclease/phosphatase family metal-dependent hydrolase
MKNRYLKFLIFFILLIGLNGLVTGSARFLADSQDSSSNQSIRLKILSYNILGGRNVDGSRNLHRIAKVINEISPDLVALQEVDRKTARLNGVDLPLVLSELTGMNYVFGRAMEYDGGEYGVAILSKFPIEEYNNHALPHLESSEPRTALAVQIKWPESEQVIVFMGTHLDYQKSPEDRIAQVHEISKIITEFQDRPIILAGDLNCLPQSESMEILEEWFKDAWKGSRNGFTFPSNEPTKRIDYILHDKKNPWVVTNIYTGLEINRSDLQWRTLLELASDHLPVIAELELRVAPLMR